MSLVLAILERNEVPVGADLIGALAEVSRPSTAKSKGNRHGDLRAACADAWELNPRLIPKARGRTATVRFMNCSFSDLGRQCLLGSALNS